MTNPNEFSDCLVFLKTILAVEYTNITYMKITFVALPQQQQIDF